MIQAIQSKQMRRVIDQIRMPSGHCQACLSDKSPDKDYMITCTLCQSSIHIKHYGRQIEEGSSSVSYDKWKCERCRNLLVLEAQNKLSQAEKMQCHFCPNTRGILKRVIFNSNETIWLHPECSTWPYPIIFQKNNRRIHYCCEYPTRPTGKFWVNLQGQQEANCEICQRKEGYKIKCMYYTCQKYFHCSCAKSIGFIRDLESMQLGNCDTYIPPYCEEHLEQRVNDCSAKVRKYRSEGDEGKASGFTQMMAAYQAQLKNMAKSAQKYKNEEEIRRQMEYQTGDKEDLIDQLSFENNEESFKSNHQSGFLDYLFDNEYLPKNKDKTSKQAFIFSKRSQAFLALQNSGQNSAKKPENMEVEENVEEERVVENLYELRGNAREPNDSDMEDSQWNSQLEEMSDQL